ENSYHCFDENLQEPLKNEVQQIIEEAYVNELEIDKKLNNKKSIRNSDTNDRQFDLYDNKRYVSEPYEKEVRYTMILKLIVLETCKVDLASINDKKDNNLCSIDKNKEKEHIRCAKEKLNRIHDSNPSED
ncbi:13933_t:CDS:2, partial [Cetraspora pellucida]